MGERMGMVLIWIALGCGDAVATPIRGAQLLDGAAEQGRAPGSGPDVPATDHCADAADWPEEFAAAEQSLFAAINAQREAGIRCGDGNGGDGDGDGAREERPRQPLELVPELRCSARLHSRDMFENDYVGRENRQGDDFRDRIRAAGLEVRYVDESIERTDADAERVLELLLDDWDDCGNLLNSELDGVGIGHYQDLWTLDFAEL